MQTLRPAAVALAALLALPPLAARTLPGLQATGASESSSPAPTPVAPTVHDGPRCGLGKAFHTGRRAALRTALGSEGVVVLRGLPDTRDYVAFRQDKAFWYLTGIEAPDVALVLDLASGREILFLPEHNARLEGWEGEKWDVGDEWVGELTGFTEVKPERALHLVIGELVEDGDTVWVNETAYIGLSGCYDRANPFDLKRKNDLFDGRPSREQALATKLEERYGVTTKDLDPALDELRRVKQPEEIEALRRASASAARAHVAAMRSTRPGLGEWQIAALMTWSFLNDGAAGPAYAAIVGSEANALILHYVDNSRVMRPGEMLLVDYGPEIDHYISDVTRSWPTDGRFTPRMAEIYDVVLAAQEAGIAAVKPGVTMRDVHEAALEVIRAAGMEKLVRHFTCHYVGMEVHDVGAMNAPFEPGVVLTVEPGLYDPDSRIGVRIEDTILVTAEGHENLSAAAPRARAEIAELVAAEGLLDRLPE